TRQPVTESQYALAQRAWDAFREPTPHALDALRIEDTTPLPFLAAALTRFLQEYPWTSDGLSRSERRFMTIVDAGLPNLSAAFKRMHENEDAYYISDTSLAELADTLARTSPPLLTLSEPSADRMWRQGSIALTEPGRAVLAGRQNRV